MSVERMRLLLEIDSVSQVQQMDGRQQINPGMRFTCDGFITKWIIGGEIQDDDENNIYPELQVWREVADNTYKKINGTRISVPASSNRRNNVIVFHNFQPVPVESGDVLGMFVPQSGKERVTLMSEETNSPTNYFVPVGDTETSPFNLIDVQSSGTTSVLLGNNIPLVSVEFGKLILCIKYKQSTITCIHFYLFRNK